MKNEKIIIDTFQIEEIKKGELIEIVGGWCGWNNAGGGFCITKNYPDRNPNDVDPNCLWNNQILP